MIAVKCISPEIALPARYRKAPAYSRQYTYSLGDNDNKETTMGCCGSKEEVDFGDLDRFRSMKHKEEGPQDNSKNLEFPLGFVEPGTALVRNAQPFLEIMASAPKLANQVKATAAVAMGSAGARNAMMNKIMGAHHLKNIFAAPLGDLGSFRAPFFPKDHEEKRHIREALKNNFVFSALSEREIRTIIDAFEECKVQAGETLIQQGDVGDYFYVIREGAVRFEVGGNVVGHAGKGKSFGELALLYTSPRAASVIAESVTTVYRVDQKTFRYIMQSQTLQTENDKKDLLQGVAFLQDLDPTDINKLVHTMIPRVFEPGEYIVRKGEGSDTFYVIQEGEVRVTDITMGSTDYEDQTLGPGEYFGERALVTKEPRTANCIGKTKGIALSIDKETFEKVVGNLAHLTMKSEDKRKLVRYHFMSVVVLCDLFLIHYFRAIFRLLSEYSK
jgi:cAMP-dependent protein kinase regulator